MYNTLFLKEVTGDITVEVATETCRTTLEASRTFATCGNIANINIDLAIADCANDIIVCLLQLLHKISVIRGCIYVYHKTENQ